MHSATRPIVILIGGRENKSKELSTMAARKLAEEGRMATSRRFRSGFFRVAEDSLEIQWISQPQRAISNMKKAAKLGGRVNCLGL